MRALLMKLVKNRMLFGDLVSTWTAFWTYLWSERALMCGCFFTNLRRFFCKKVDGTYRKEKLFRNGMDRFFKEIDLVEVIKAVRMSKLYLRTLTHKNQRLLLNLQR